MKPYPAYKDSGIEWLGEIPQGWKLRRLKYISNIRLSNVDKKFVEGEQKIKLCNYVDVYYNDYITDEIDFMTATAGDNQIENFVLKKGDVLITKDSESPYDIAVPAFVVKDFNNVVCGYHLSHIRPDENKTDGNYLFRLFQASQFQAQFEIEANGITRYGISKAVISNSLFLLPPLEEQAAIAAFLDRKTQQIDRLLEIQQKQIELLKEQRTALINQAVTKGLNPTVEMKDSGIEWLGEIPWHWRVRRLKYIVSDKITDGPHETPELVDNGVHFISAEAVQNERINFDSARGFITCEQHEIYSQKVLPKKGDIFFVKSGATTGKIAFVHTDRIFSIWSPIALIRTKHNLAYNHFVFYTLLASFFQTQVQLEWSYGTQPNIGMKVLENLKVFIPPLQEQAAIAHFLDRKTQQIDRLMEIKQKQMALLKEQRTALISAVVTGKMDVRATNIL